MKTRLYISIISFFIFSVSFAQDFAPYQHNFGFWEFRTLPNTYGSGRVSVMIRNNVLTVSTNSSFASSPLKTGNVVKIETEDTLPNLILGNLKLSSGIATSYQMSILDNWIVLQSTVNEAVSSMTGSFTIDLTPDNPDDNNKPVPIFQPIDENYIHTVTPLYPVEESALNFEGAIKSVTYFDGLGREKQAVQIGASATEKDIVVHAEYDAKGNSAKEYLPYPTTQYDGAYIVAAKQGTLNYYNTSKYENSLNPYSEKVFDNSPLNSILEVAAPGNTWGYDTNKVTSTVQVYTTPAETYPNFSQSWPLNVFLDNPLGGTGNVIFSIGNGGIAQLSFNGSGFLPTTFRQGDIATVTGIELPNIGFGIININNIPSGFDISVIDNKIHIYKAFNNTNDFTNLNTIIEKDIRAVENIEYAERNSSNHTIKNGYKTNDNGEVKKFRVEFSSGNISDPSLTMDEETYFENQLLKVITKDENWQPNQIYPNDRTTEEFTNKQGQVILKRTYNLGMSHDTYYVYDYLGNLSYVIPPKVDISDGVDAIELSELCYQYKYDSRNRLVEKKVPGKGWEYIVYNKLDQPVLTQDANLQAQGHWLFTKYDAFGRVAYTGQIETDNADRVAMQTAAYLVVPQFETRSAPTAVGGTTLNYTNQSFPLALDPNYLYGISEILTINYYDDYAFDLDGGVSETAYGLTPITNAKGLPTGSKVKVLGADIYITTITYYDHKARAIYTYTKNDYLSTIDKVKFKIDFTGKPLEIITLHSKRAEEYISISTGGAPPPPDICVLGCPDPPPPTYNMHTIVEKFTYDHAGLLLAQTHQINGNPVQRIADNTYDELGQLVGKNVGGKTTQASLQNVDYTYNIRGWLKTINDVNNIGTEDLFAFKLGYNEGTSPLYNGNISSAQWKTRNTDGSLKTYNYAYDALNRITNATDNTGRYNLSGVSYDKNGNILTLQRQGHIDANATLFGSMDNLVYDYAGGGNKLTKVSDNGNVTYGFKDGTNVGDDFTYDQNGNMKTDANKGITNITYNHLNLPASITFKPNSYGVPVIRYVYDATGAKLSKSVATEFSDIHITAKYDTIQTTQYTGAGFVYEKMEYVSYYSRQSYPAELQFVATAEGYAEPKADGTFEYVYQYKDHLGNIRLSYSDVSTTSTPILQIREENNYYPFGLKHKGYNFVVNGKDHKYRYNSKEFQNELNLNVYDYQARNYDPAIGRWMNIDPLAEEGRRWSPYNYAMDNPVFFIDPDGMLSQSFIDNLWNKSGNSETTWTNNGDGSFSDGNGNSVGSEEGGEEEDCCPGMERNLDRMIVTRQAEKKGENLVQALNDYKTGMRDKEWGEAVLIAAKEATVYYAGGWAIKTIFRGGRYVYIAYRANQAAKGLGKFKYAGEYGIQSYKILKELTTGKGLQVHHLIEQRFASTLGVQASSMQSIALTTAEHQVFTNAWRAQIGYRTDNALIRTTNASKEQIYEAAKVVYKDYPTILKALGL